MSGEPDPAARVERVRARRRRAETEPGPLELELVRRGWTREAELARAAREYDVWLERELARLEAERERDACAALLADTFALHDELELERDRSP